MDALDHAQRTSLAHTFYNNPHPAKPGNMGTCTSANWPICHPYSTSTRNLPYPQRTQNIHTMTYHGFVVKVKVLQFTNCLGGTAQFLKDNPSLSPQFVRFASHNLDDVPTPRQDMVKTFFQFCREKEYSKGHRV